MTFLMIILSRCQKEKVCLDCACVYGLHVGPSRCTSISMFFAWIFGIHFAVAFFIDFSRLGIEFGSILALSRGENRQFWRICSHVSVKKRNFRGVFSVLFPSMF